MSERVEVPDKPLFSQNESKRGRKSDKTRYKFSYASAETEEIKSSTSKCNSTSSCKNTSLDAHHPKPDINVHKCFRVGTSKHLDSIVMGNHKELRGIMRIPQMILIHENHI